MTFEEIQAALKNISDALNAKGINQLCEPSMSIYANEAKIMIWNVDRWTHNDDSAHFIYGKTAREAFDKSHVFIAALLSSEDRNLHKFMHELGRVIDSGKTLGVDIKHLNPLQETLKTLTNNILTYQPQNKG